MGEDIYCLPQSNCSTTIMPDYDNLSSSNDSIYDYDYDSSDSSHAIYWGELAPVLIVYSLTYIIGVTGNVLIIYTVLRFKRLKSPTNIFLISLSSADLILVLLCIPVKVRCLHPILLWLGTNVWSQYDFYVNSLLPEFFFRRFSRYSPRWALFVYRVIVATLIGNYI